MPTYKINWIKKIQIKGSKNASNKMGQNLSRKTAAAKRIFLPDLHMCKNYETIQAYRGWKFAVTFKIWAYSELHIRNKKSYRTQIRAGMKSLNTISNLFNPQWVKLGTLLKILETKLKTKSLVTGRGRWKRKLGRGSMWRRG